MNALAFEPSVESSGCVALSSLMSGEQRHREAVLVEGGGAAVVTAMHHQSGDVELVTTPA